MLASQDPVGHVEEGVESDNDDFVADVNLTPSPPTPQYDATPQDDGFPTPRASTPQNDQILTLTAATPQDDLILTHRAATPQDERIPTPRAATPQDERMPTPRAATPPEPSRDGDVDRDNAGEDNLFDGTQSSIKYTPQQVDSAWRDLADDDDDVDASTSKQFFVAFNKDPAHVQPPGSQDDSAPAAGFDDIGFAHKGLQGTVTQDDPLIVETQHGAANVNGDEDPSQPAGKSHPYHFINPPIRICELLSSVILFFVYLLFADSTPGSTHAVSDMPIMMKIKEVYEGLCRLRKDPKKKYNFQIFNFP